MTEDTKKKGRGTRPRGKSVDVWLLPEEKEELVERAKQAGRTDWLQISQPYADSAKHSQSLRNGL